MGATSNDSSSSSMSPLSSPSSVVFVDLYGKRRQVAKVQVLEREINLLQEEIKSLAKLELASNCCKEVDEFVEATQDPLIAVNRTRGGSRSFWKKLRRKIGSMLRCCCCCCCCGCCNMINCCACCRGSQQKPETSEHCMCQCPEVSCQCSCNPSCPKCSICCCCKTCSCF